nr:MAG TPA: hypothetical protein [Caudoviricetes sp.]
MAAPPLVKSLTRLPLRRSRLRCVSSLVSLRLR